MHLYTFCFAYVTIILLACRYSHIFDFRKCLRILLDIVAKCLDQMLLTGVCWLYCNVWPKVTQFWLSRLPLLKLLTSWCLVLILQSQNWLRESLSIQGKLTITLVFLQARLISPSTLNLSHTVESLDKIYSYHMYIELLMHLPQDYSGKGWKACVDWTHWCQNEGTQRNPWGKLHFKYIFVLVYRCYNCSSSGYVFTRVQHMHALTISIILWWMI